MADLRGGEVLQNEIEKSRDRLKNFNENIKKLTGFENPGPRTRRILSGEGHDFDDGFPSRMGRGRGRLFGMAKRGLMEEVGPPVKRRVLGGAFSRLGPAPVAAYRRDREESPDEDELPNKSLQSSVVATSREAKNREEIMQEQTKDKEGMQRNRRMFGLLLGTLNKFKTESKTLESKEEQRKRIDKKLEENAEKEKKKFKQETKQLMEEKHLEESRISRLEQKMEVVMEHGDWEKEVKKLKNFICTKVKPQIFWLPRQMSSAMDSKLKESNTFVEDMLKEGQDRLEMEIQDVMEREHKREERIKMRLREDGLFQEEEEEKEKGDDKGDEKNRAGEGNIKRTFEVEGQIRLEVVNEQAGAKSKQKRRVVIEEDSNIGSDSEGEEEGEDENSSEKGKKSLKDSENLGVEFEVSESRKTKKKSDDKENTNDSDSDDNENPDDNDAHDSKYSQNTDGAHRNGEDDGKSDEILKVKRKEEDENEVSGDDEEITNRYHGHHHHSQGSKSASQHRASSREKERLSRRDRSRGDSRKEKDRHERKSSRDRKHSSKHSKHSRRDNERIVIKQERGEEEKQKHRTERRSHDKERDEEEEDGEGRQVAKSKPDRLQLIGEEEDVEMESEANTTL